MLVPASTALRPCTLRCGHAGAGIHCTADMHAALRPRCAAACVMLRAAMLCCSHAAQRHRTACAESGRGAAASRKVAVHLAVAAVALDELALD
jgi:hypothetical protein